MCQNYNIPSEALKVAETPNRLPPWYDFAHFCDFTLTCHKKKETPLEHIRQDFSQLQEKYNDYTEFYTDGSKTKQHVGSAVVSEHWEHCLRLPQFASVFTAEVYALLMALEKIVTVEYKKAVVYTDSLSLLNSLHRKSECEPFLGYILKTLGKSEKHGQVIRLCWIPSHMGIPGNEKADKCAAMAGREKITEINLPFKDCVRVVRAAITSKWQQDWGCQENNKLQIVKPILQEWKTSYHQERFMEVILCRVRIGHTHLTHNFLLKNEEQAVCDQCQELLTVNHILITCPALEEKRQKYFYEFYKTLTPLHPSLILAENALVSLDNVFKFLDETGFLNKF
ncbi:uncharacterized protein LOC125941841 [Dermacentor silvarum]|uniref:uncharacterized protein LOC125941841 n=1 Tax=Dermacentor silvarum TaxID=543639 RepID=UPI002100D558|nr:uncharacterized protein LOC125941841 [Dermacentor silvarum]